MKNEIGDKRIPVGSPDDDVVGAVDTEEMDGLLREADTERGETIPAQSDVTDLPAKKTDGHRKISFVASSAELDNVRASQVAGANNRKSRALRHQSTSLTGDTRADWYDEDLLHRAVADAGRWAYGTVFVEVWLLTEDELALVRPHRGWWMDPVHHSQYHNVAGDDDGAKQAKAKAMKSKAIPSSIAKLHASGQHAQMAHCPICRLVDETNPNFIEPGFHVPGEGLPGVLWADDHNAHFLRDGSTRRLNNSSHFGGKDRSIRGSFRKKQMSGQGSNRKSFRGGSNLSGYLFPQMQKMYNKDESSSEPYGLRPEGTVPNVDAEDEPKQAERKDRITATSRPNLQDGTSQPGRRLIHRHHAVEVVWRDVKQLADDPDSPWNPRLQHLADMGLGYAAAVPIRHDGVKSGIVVYMARRDVDLDRLKSPTNEAYLIAASGLITAALILRGPRHAAMKDRKKEFSDAMHRIRLRILEARALGIPLDEIVERNAKKKEEEEKKDDQNEYENEIAEALGCIRDLFGEFGHLLASGLRLLWKRFRTILRKSMGAKVQPPPAFTWIQSAHTFFGSLVTLLILTKLGDLLMKKHGPDYAIILGPFGALMTLIYGLTAAPASQPRNCILGQVVSLSIALCLSYIPLEGGWDKPMRISVTTALAIAAQTKLGIIHPPAGASALLFASNDLDWTHFATMLLANVIAVMAGAFINNASPSRQYPTYWGFPLWAEIHTNKHE